MPNPYYYEDNDRHQTRIYPNLGIVIKIFADSEHDSYETEKKFYEAFVDWQGQFIPVLHGAGRCADSERRFLIISCEGEAVGSSLSQDER
jgi:hypothetical protein